MRLQAHQNETELQGIPGALLRPSRKRRQGPTRASKPEAVTQDLTEQYLKLLGLPWLHIPAFVLASAFRRRNLSGPELGAAQEAAEAVRGLPDILTFERGRFLAIELKTEIGKMSHAQLVWQERLGTKLCRTFEDAKRTIDSWRRND